MFNYQWVVFQEKERENWQRQQEENLERAAQQRYVTVRGVIHGV